MKKKIILIITAFLFVSIAQAQMSMDAVTVLKEGQIIAQSADADTALFNYRVYRIFLKKVPEGFLVQELYKDSNVKATDPFILEKATDLTRIPYAYYAEPISDLSITGDYNIWYENGQKRQEGSYLHGKKDGFWTRWYSSGQKNAEGAYKLGKLDGLWRMWNIDGSNMNETYFKNGRLEAILSDIRDDKTGAIKSLSSSDNTERNIWLEWDEQGRLRSQVMLVNGKKEGVWVAWDDKGKREMLGYYKNDKRDGTWKTFWLGEDEVKRSEGQYRNGKKEGIWVFWDKQGEKLKEEYYRQGKLIPR